MRNGIPDQNGSGPDLGFGNAPLSDMAAVGRVTGGSARIWLRTLRRQPVRIRVSGDASHTVAYEQLYENHADPKRDHAWTVEIPPQPGLNRLAPHTSYRYEARYAVDDALIGSGTFETFPMGTADAPDRFALAVMSCNLPFEDDGSVSPGGAAMLRAVERCLQDNRVKLVLAVGDQMYTDYPESLSLWDQDYFRRIAPPGRERIQDCTAQEVRSLIHDRYRHFWNLEGWRSLYAHYPCYPILDDHEMVDNWGSDAAHSTAEWAAFGQGSRGAYFDYQGSRVCDPQTGDGLPADFDFQIAYGPISIFALDLRSNRRAGDDPRIYSAEQEQRFLRFLADNQDQEALFIVLSVPIAHLPRWMAKLGRFLTPSGEDFSDRWSTAGHVKDRDKLLQHLRAHQRRCPGQRMSLLSGDIHIGCVHEIAWSDGSGSMVQMISSGITHHVALPVQIGSKLSIRCKGSIAVEDDDRAASIKILPGTTGYRLNPYGKLNLGIVECRRQAEGLQMRFKLYGHQGDKPACVYCSEWR